MTIPKLTPDQHAALGERAAELLKLKRKRSNKRFDTTWGDFSAEGLGALIIRLANDAFVSSGTVFTAVPRKVKEDGSIEIYVLDERGDLIAFDGVEHAPATRDFMLRHTIPADLESAKCRRVVQAYLALPNATGCTTKIATRLAPPRRKAPSKPG